jgi:sugar diacid utilization regulator
LSAIEPKTEQQLVEPTTDRDTSHPTEAHGLLRAVMSLDDRLSATVMAGEGLEGVAQALRDVTRRDASVWTLTGQLLATTDGNGSLDLDAATARDGRYGEWLCRAVETVDEGVVVGLRDVNGDSGPFEELALAQAARVAAVERYRMRSVAHSELKQWGDLTTAMLDEEDPERVATLAESLGVDLEQERRVVVLPPEISKPDRDRLRLDARALDEDAMETTRDEQAVFILRNEIDWSAFRRSVEQTGDESIRVGASRVAASVQELPSALREARIALRMSEAIDGPRVTHFEDLGLYQLFATADPAELDRLVRQWLEPVLEYDRERDAELLRSLSEYLEHGCSLDRAAAALYIHRSTLRYRLGRIEELLDRDLQDPDTRFNLQLATRVLATLEAMQRGEPRRR